MVPQTGTSNFFFLTYLHCGFEKYEFFPTLELKRNHPLPNNYFCII